MCQESLNFEWVVLAMSGRAAGVKGGRSPAQRTLDAGSLPGTLADMADAACCRIGPEPLAVSWTRPRA
jgi:hypothetical protein